MERALFHILAVTVQTLLLSFAAPLQAQQSRPDFEGMWSDPPPTAADSFCYFACTDTGIEHLNKLLDDPANDDRPYGELSTEASNYQREQYVRPRLTAAALETFPLDPADDRGFLYCEPWGFARQILAPHQLEIRQHADRIEMRYGEWEARRSIPLDSGARPASQPLRLLGHSVGHYEGETLVIETSGIGANVTPFGGNPTEWFEHSDQLRAVERYTRSEDGERLELRVTLEDPWSLKEPLLVRKVWGWAPQEEIFPYEDCERPTEFSRGVNQP